MSDTNYQVTISMSQVTILALQNSSLNLQGFIVAQSSDTAGLPVVWYEMPSRSLLPAITVAWAGQYRAYLSTGRIAAGAQISVGASVPIAPGQTWEVEAAGGVQVDGEAGSGPDIFIHNTTSTPFTCGISQQQDGNFIPICAFPLYGNYVQAFTPAELILLRFSTWRLGPGAVVVPASYPAAPAGDRGGPQGPESCSPGVLIDLTADNRRGVTFDIDEGWSWGDGSWAQTFPANADLVPLVIRPPQPASPESDFAGALP